MVPIRSNRLCRTFGEFQAGNYIDAARTLALSAAYSSSQPARPSLPKLKSDGSVTFEFW
jgi:hypothetical protein